MSFASVVCLGLVRSHGDKCGQRVRIREQGKGTSEGSGTLKPAHRGEGVQRAGQKIRIWPQAIATKGPEAQQNDLTTTISILIWVTALVLFTGLSFAFVRF